MIEKLRKYPVAAVIIFCIYYLVGVFGLSADRTQFLFQSLIPFTMLFGIYFLWLFTENATPWFYVTALLIFLAGFLIEIIGVNTGAIFGDYVYGKSLGFKLWDTPIMIGVNWLLLIYSCWVLTRFISGNRWLRFLAGSALMVLYDIVLEPVATRLDMWYWYDEAVPLRNYIAWFLISFMLFIIFERGAGRIRNKIAPALFIIQFMFFIVLNIIFYYS